MKANQGIQPNQAPRSGRPVLFLRAPSCETREQVIDFLVGTLKEGDFDGWELDVYAEVGPDGLWRGAGIFRAAGQPT